MCSFAILLCITQAGRQILPTWLSESPGDWHDEGEVHGQSSVTLTFAIKQRNLSELEELFWQISDPQHPKYQQFLSSQQITNMVAPHSLTIEALHNELDKHGISRENRQLRGNQDFMKVRANASAFVAMLDVNLRRYRHRHSGEQYIRSTNPPVINVSIIDFIGGLTHLPQRRLVEHQLPSVDEPPSNIPAVFWPMNISGVNRSSFSHSVQLVLDKAVAKLLGEQVASMNFVQEISFPLRGMVACVLKAEGIPEGGPGSNPELEKDDAEAQVIIIEDKMKQVTDSIQLVAIMNSMLEKQKIGTRVKSIDLGIPKLNGIDPLSKMMNITKPPFSPFKVNLTTSPSFAPSAVPTATPTTIPTANPTTNFSGLGTPVRPTPSPTPQTNTMPKGNSPLVAIPFTWRTENSVLMVALRCSDGTLMSSEGVCATDKIVSAKVTIATNTTSNKSSNRSKVFMLDAMRSAKSCLPCAQFTTTYNGFALRSLCTHMLKSVGSSMDTALFCLFNMSTSSYLGTEIGVNIQATFEAKGAELPLLSASSNCVPGERSDMCAAAFYLQPPATPLFLHKQYAIPEELLEYTKQVDGDRTSQGMTAFFGHFYTHTALDAFLQNYSVIHQAADLNKYLQVEFVTETKLEDADQVPNLESTSDLQLLMGVAPEITTTYWAIKGDREAIDGADAAERLDGGRADQEPFLKFCLELSEDSTPPAVISLDYEEKERVMPARYTDRLNTEFMKAGLRGISIVTGAGDDGVGGFDKIEICRQFEPQFPASSPYVTVVGGTSLRRHSDKMVEQSADAKQGCSITTGGGFSNRYKQPQYQKFAVTNYLNQTHKPPESYYDKSGRGYPDLAVIAENFLAYEEPLGLQSYGGTSASASVMTAIVALLNQNQNQMGQNKTALGFLNPMLYTINEFESEAFVDVVHGNNRCSRTPNKCCHFGFEAQKGWDPVSGLGSPRVATLLTSIAHWNASDCVLGNSSLLAGCGKYSAQAANSQPATSSVTLAVTIGVIVTGAIVGAVIYATKTSNRREGYQEVSSANTDSLKFDFSEEGAADSPVDAEAAFGSDGGAIVDTSEYRADDLEI